MKAVYGSLLCWWLLPLTNASAFRSDSVTTASTACGVVEHTAFSSAHSRITYSPPASLNHHLNLCFSYSRSKYRRWPPLQGHFCHPLGRLFHYSRNHIRDTSSLIHRSSIATSPYPTRPWVMAFSAANSNNGVMASTSLTAPSPSADQPSIMPATDSTLKSTTITSEGSAAGMPTPSGASNIRFGHVHIYVDELKDLEYYQSLQEQLDQYATEVQREEESANAAISLPQKREIWQRLTAQAQRNQVTTGSTLSMVASEESPDLVEQLLVGMGFRIRASRYPTSELEVSASLSSHHLLEHLAPDISYQRTRSLLITSSDSAGVQFLVSAVTTSPSLSSSLGTTCGTATSHDSESSYKADDAKTDMSSQHPSSPVSSTLSDMNVLRRQDSTVVDYMYDAARIQHFFRAHDDRAGIAVLSFVVADIQPIFQRYHLLHPHLIARYFECNDSNTATSARRNEPLHFEVENEDKDEKKSDDETRLVRARTEKEQILTSQYRMLEVYAYYQRSSTHHPGHSEEQHTNACTPDTGTIIRFIEFVASSFNNDDNIDHVIPGLTLLPRTTVALDQKENIAKARSEPPSPPVYFDHWVSNVHSRTDFLNVLSDTLQFESQIDFNAGVVAAGEAQIESTVTGNVGSPLEPLLSVEHSFLEGLETTTDDEIFMNVFRDQSQVYLPINNALSTVGHVHGFLQEIGQGVQHIASRVQDLVSFVSRANEFHHVTGRGITFLQIPRSYYGTLTSQHLVDAISSTNHDVDCHTTNADLPLASAIIVILQEASILSEEGVLDLDASAESIHSILERELHPTTQLPWYQLNRPALISTILRSRYSNIYSLLREHIVDEQQYLAIVRNQILVDVQGGDILYQIFTSKILARQSRDEAPFLEFIQRVCRPGRAIRSGCGGFGIRNFLTLFLSIEVTKAMREVTDARRTNDLVHLQYAQQMVEYFTAQLNESNPILTKISDAMTDEGVFRDALLAVEKQQEVMGNELTIHKLQSRLADATARKAVGNTKLLECSAKYNQLMKRLRESHSQK